MYEDQESISSADAGDLEFVAEELGTGRGVDPLQALLSLDKTVDDVQETVTVKLVDGTPVEWTYRPLKSEEIEEARDRCTRFVKRGRGGKTAELDENAMTNLLIATATTNPDLNNQALKSKFKARQPEDVVRAAFLPGTAEGLLSKIMDATGYSDELVAVGKS